MSGTDAPEVPPAEQPKRTSIKAVRPHDVRPDPRELRDRSRLALEVKGSLERIRKTAENWRTGMATLTALVTASHLFKGRNSIIEYAEWVRYTLALSVLCSLVLSVGSLWLFLTAAYGRLELKSAQSILDSGGVDVHNVQLAEAALNDLRLARKLSVFAAALLALALLTSWFGPAGRRPQTIVTLVVANESSPSNEMPLCGELKALDGRVTVIQVSGEPQPRRINTGQLVALSVVESCQQSK